MKKMQFKVDDNEVLSAALQTVLFELGCEWASSGKRIKQEVKNLIFGNGKMITRPSPSKICEQVDPVEFILKHLDTKPIDYEGCDPVVQFCLERGLTVNTHEGVVNGYDIVMKKIQVP